MCATYLEAAAREGFGALPPLLDRAPPLSCPHLLPIQHLHTYFVFTLEGFQV
jgi:hypothetical protein